MKHKKSADVVASVKIKRENYDAYKALLKQKAKESGLNQGELIFEMLQADPPRTEDLLDDVKIIVRRVMSSANPKDHHNAIVQLIKLLDIEVK